MSYRNGFCKIDNGDNNHKCLASECFREWTTCSDRIELDLTEFNGKLEKVKRWVIRAYGNAELGWDSNNLPYHVVKDIGNIATAIGLTEEEKEHALNLMDGDIYTRVRSSEKKVN